VTRPTRRLREPAFPLWFKLWFAFCVLLGLGFAGLIAWAIIAIVGKVTR
jgi:hypothetical protein